MVAVIAFVGQQAAEGAGGLDQGLGHADIVDVAGAEQQHTRLATLVNQTMDLGRAPAASPAQKGKTAGTELKSG